MSKTFNVREYQPGDSESVYALILAILTNEFREIPPEHYLSDIKDIQSVYAGERNEFFVCENDGEIIGTIAVKEDDKKTALLRRLFVNPHFRGKKAGKTLIEKALAFCREKHYEKIVFTGNNRMHDVKEVLKKLGFKEAEDIQLPGLELFRMSHAL